MKPIPHPPNPPPPAPPAPPPVPAALTFTRLDGTPFVRDPAVEAELTAVLAQDPATWGRRAGAMASETLVHLCRLLTSSKDRGRRRLGELLLVLDQRVAKLVQKSAQGFDETTIEEIAAQVSQRILEGVLAATADRATEFLEVRFDAAVARWTLTAVAKRRRRAPSGKAVARALKRDEEPLAGQVTTEEASFDGTRVTDPEALLVAAEAAPPPEVEELFRALEAVRDPRHREAVVLHYLQGWPIRSRDRETETLCSRFGVSDRQIRTWIAGALADMRHALGETS